MLKIKKLRKEAILPERSTEYAAGYDLYCCKDQDLGQGLNKVALGFAMQIPNKHYARIACRSSLAGHGMSVEAGVIDEDYRGEVIVMLRCRQRRNIKSGFKIAQMIITPYATPQVEEVDTLSDSERGEGGFGSTGAFTIVNK